MPTDAPASHTVTRRLVDELLDGDLDAYVEKRRRSGRSWRLIARDLRDDIGVDVTDRTLLTWYRDMPWSRSS